MAVSFHKRINIHDEDGNNIMQARCFSDAIMFIIGGEERDISPSDAKFMAEEIIKHCDEFGIE